MARRFGSIGVGIAIALALSAVLAYVWIDGGRQPLRDIAEPVPVPAITGQ